MRRRMTGVGTAASNNGMQLTRPVQVAASQLIPSVRRLAEER